MIGILENEVIGERSLKKQNSQLLQRINKLESRSKDYKYLVTQSSEFKYALNESIAEVDI